MTEEEVQQLERAVVLLQLGIPVALAQKLLGNRDIRTTMIYVRGVDKLKEEATRKWDEI